MSEDKKLYWQGNHPLGGGKNQIVMGDVLPESLMDDPRLEGWKDDGTVSSEAVVNFAKKKQNELENSQLKVMELEDKIEGLDSEIKDLKKRIKPVKVKK